MGELGAEEWCDLDFLGERLVALKVSSRGSEALP